MPASDIACPSCGASIAFVPVVGAIGICPSCLRSLVIDGKNARLATGDDTTVLDDGDLAKLRKARAKFRQALS